MFNTPGMGLNGLKRCWTTPTFLGPRPAHLLSYQFKHEPLADRNPMLPLPYHRLPPNQVPILRTCTAADSLVHCAPPSLTHLAALVWRISLQTFCREHVFQHDCLSSSVTASSPSVSRPPKSTLEGRCQVPACSNKRMTTWNLQGVSKATGETKEDPETLLTTKGDEVVCRLCRGAFCLSYVSICVLISFVA